MASWLGFNDKRQNRCRNRLNPFSTKKISLRPASEPSASTMSVTNVSKVGNHTFQGVTLNALHSTYKILPCRESVFYTLLLLLLSLHVSHSLSMTLMTHTASKALIWSI